MSELFDRMTRARLVPVVVLDSASDAEPLAHALLEGGLPVAEVTFRTAAAEESIRAMSTIPEMLVGAGTVRTVEQVNRAADAGARFIVSPGFSAAVVKRSLELDLPVFPGTVTATEIQAASELGLSTLKFFPAETSGGAKAIKALAAPFPDITFIPTGGIGPANLAEYLSVPAVVAVGGSWMVAKSDVANNDFAKITALTREAVALASSL